MLYAHTYVRLGLHDQGLQVCDTCVLDDLYYLIYTTYLHLSRMVSTHKINSSSSIKIVHVNSYTSALWCGVIYVNCNVSVLFTYDPCDLYDLCLI